MNVSSRKSIATLCRGRMLDRSRPLVGSAVRAIVVVRRRDTRADGPQSGPYTTAKRHRVPGTVGRARGVVAVQLMVVLVVLIGFAALAIDVGAMYNTRSDLIGAADAAALAGVTFYATDLSRAIQSGDYAGDPLAAMTDEVNGRAQEIAYENYAFGRVRLIVDAEDIRVGWFDYANPNAPLNTAALASTFNAVEVTVRRTDISQNGALDLFFAGIFGKSEANITATAVAAFDDRFAAYVPPGPITPFIPFAIQEDVFDEQLVSGPDDFGYDGDLETVTAFGDDVPEIHLFPYRESGAGDGVGAGNFGLLNVGNPNQGVPELREQILNGVTADELLAETGTSALTFIDEEGGSVTYTISGAPGMKNGVESAVEARVGDVIGFFLYAGSMVEGEGANTIYTVTSIRFGRILDVHLTGAPDDRAIVVQPVVYAGSDIAVDPSAASTGGLVASMTLVR